MLLLIINKREDKMEYTAIYNMKSSKFTRFDDEKIPSIIDVLTSDDYYVFKSFEASDLDEAYYILNMEHPKNIVDTVGLLAASDPDREDYKTLHTSMSVGDVLVENGTKYYFCDSFGWKEME